MLFRLKYYSITVSSLLKLLVQHILSEKGNNPSLIDQLHFIEVAAERLGYSRGGRNVYDLMDRGLTSLDQRAKEALTLMQTQFGQRQFNPEYSMTPEEKQRKARMIEAHIRDAEKRLEVENQFINQFYRLKLGSLVKKRS